MSVSVELIGVHTIAWIPLFFLLHCKGQESHIKPDSSSGKPIDTKVCYLLFSYPRRQCVSLFSGSFSKPVLTPSPTASASLGTSVKFTCTLNSEHSIYTNEWYQQPSDKVPKYLMYVNRYENYSKIDGIPDCFSGSGSGPCH